MILIVSGYYRPTISRHVIHQNLAQADGFSILPFPHELAGLEALAVIPNVVLVLNLMFRERIIGVVSIMLGFFLRPSSGSLTRIFPNNSIMGRWPRPEASNEGGWHMLDFLQVAR